MKLFRRRHRFEVIHRVYEPGVPLKWYRVLVQCRRCDEERKVYHLLDIPNTINREFCP